MKKILNKIFSYQEFRFIFVGGLNTIVGYGLYALLLFFGVHYLIANTVSTIIGILHSFIWNRFFTFKSKEKALNELVKFASVYLASFIIGTFTLFTFKQILNINVYIAGLINLVITTFISYFGHKYISFNKNISTKDIIKKIYNKIKPNIPFILLFIFYFLLTFKIGFVSDDAINHNKTYDNGMINYLIHSYNHWSSRVFIYFVNNIFYMLPMMVWKIINAFIIVIGAKCISILFNDKKNIHLDYIICLLITLFPYNSMGSAGYIATTLTYYWPIVFVLICLLPLKKLDKGQKINKWLFPLYFVLLMYATDSEQICLVLCGISITYFIYFKFIKKEKVSSYIYFLIILTLLKIIFIKTCPGNAERTLKEMDLRFPEYKYFSLFDKLYIGILYIVNILKLNYILPLISAIFLCIYTNINSKKIYDKIIANINMILVCLFTIFEKLTILVVPDFTKSINYVNEHILIKNYAIDYMAVFMIFIIFASFLYLLIINFKKDILVILIVLAGLLSQLIMAFSPTIYASSTRTSSIMYYSFIILNLCLFKKMKLKEKHISWIYTLLLLFSILYFVYFIMPR